MTVRTGRHRVSIIVLTWNRKEVLARCLRTIEQTVPDREDVELVVVDNGSTDGTPELLKRDFPGFRVLRIDPNAGVSNGLNTGLAGASKDSEFIVLLNNDLEFTGDWLSALLAPALQDKKTGLVGCKLRYPSGLLQHAGCTVGESDLRPTHMGQNEADDGRYDAVAEMPVVTGAVLLLRREVFETIGTFDAGFSPYLFEDVDLCLRARRAGYRIMYTGKTEIIHHERSTLQADAPASVLRISFRNHLRLILRNYRGHRLARVLPRLLPRDLLYMARKGMAGVLVGAWRDVFSGLGGILRGRKQNAARWPLLK